MEAERCKRCSLCGISYPYYGHGDICDVCGGPLSPIQDAPDADWRDTVALAKAEREAVVTSGDKVLDWRMHELSKAGYDRTTAAAIAVKSTIDLHRAIELVTVQGCDPATAAAILL